MEACIGFKEFDNNGCMPTVCNLACDVKVCDVAANNKDLTIILFK